MMNQIYLVLWLFIPGVFLIDCDVPDTCVCESIRVNCTGLTTTSNIRHNTRDYNLNDNNLPQLDENSFKLFKKMEYLTLQNCNIETVDVDTFTFSPLLGTLDLGHNMITELPPNLFQNTPDLQTFSCENNNLSAIDNGLFRGLVHLDYVRLNGNQISSLSRYAFQDLADLKVLYLMNNRLHTPHWKWISHFDHTGNYELYFDGNPWSCDCKMKNFLTKLVNPRNTWYQQKENQLSMPYCREPESLKNRLVSTLQPEELICIKPDVTSASNTIVANEGAPSSFKCSGSGLPTPQVYITDESTKRITEIKTGVVYMNFTTTTLDAAGEYICFVNGTNPSNHISVATVTFNIKVKPKPSSAAGVVVGVLILIAVVGGMVTLFVRRRKKRSGYGSLHNEDPLLYEIRDGEDGLMTPQMTEHVNRYPDDDDDDVIDEYDAEYAKESTDDKEVLV